LKSLFSKGAKGILIRSSTTAAIIPEKTPTIAPSPGPRTTEESLDRKYTAIIPPPITHRQHRQLTKGIPANNPAIPPPIRAGVNIPGFCSFITASP